MVILGHPREGKCVDGTINPIQFNSDTRDRLVNVADTEAQTRTSRIHSPVRFSLRYQAMCVYKRNKICLNRSLSYLRSINNPAQYMEEEEETIK